MKFNSKSYSLDSRILIHFIYTQLVAHPSYLSKVWGFDSQVLIVFFNRDGSFNSYFGHSLPTADLSRAIVSS